MIIFSDHETEVFSLIFLNLKCNNWIVYLTSWQLSITLFALKWSEFKFVRWFQNRTYVQNRWNLNALLLRTFYYDLMLCTTDSLWYIFSQEKNFWNKIENEFRVAWLPTALSYVLTLSSQQVNIQVQNSITIGSTHQSLLGVVERYVDTWLIVARVIPSGNRFPLICHHVF